jgi:hypothetical protein
MQRPKNGAGIDCRLASQTRGQAAGQLAERIGFQGTLGFGHEAVPSEVEISLFEHKNAKYATLEVSRR